MKLIFNDCAKYIKQLSVILPSVYPASNSVTAGKASRSPQDA